MVVGLPASGVGRAAKCGKEEIIGLLTALRLFVEENSEERHVRWLGLCEEIANALRGRRGTTVAVVLRKYKGAPAVELALDEDEIGRASCRERVYSGV